jgi:hypothetical protein
VLGVERFLQRGDVDLVLLGEAELDERVQPLQDAASVGEAGAGRVAAVELIRDLVERFGEGDHTLPRHTSAYAASHPRVVLRREPVT